MVEGFHATVRHLFEDSEIIAALILFSSQFQHVSINSSQLFSEKAESASAWGQGFSLQWKRRESLVLWPLWPSVSYRWPLTLSPTVFQLTSFFTILLKAARKKLETRDSP